MSFIVLSSALWVGCGKPDGEAGEEAGRMINVDGKARFQSYCLDDAGGTPAYERPLELWKCDLPVDEVKLTDNLPVVTLIGDCEKGTLTVRPQGPGLKESTWELPPRNEQGIIPFDFDVPFGSAQLANDGFGNINCTIRLNLNLYGTMNCPAGPTNRYKPTIEVNAIYEINRSTQATTTTTTTTSSTTTFVFPTTTRPVDDGRNSPLIARTREIRPAVLDSSSFAAGGGCALPPNCYFFTTTLMKQCQ